MGLRKPVESIPLSFLWSQANGFRCFQLAIGNHGKILGGERQGRAFSLNPPASGWKLDRSALALCSRKKGTRLPAFVSCHIS